MITRTLISKLSFLAAALALGACGPGVDLATRAVLTPMPAQIVAGQPLGLVVTIQTNQFETVEAYEGEITVTLVQGPNPAALGGATTVKAVKGVATFSDLTLTKVGQGYVLKVKAATVPGGRSLPEKTTEPITVIAGPASGISLITQPGKTAPGGVVYPFPRVAVADAHGNVIANQSAAITVSLGANPGGSTLTGTATLNTLGGVAEFTDLSLDQLGAGYTLTFTAAGAGTVTSTPFDVAQPRLVYTDPDSGPSTAPYWLRLVKNAALSTDSLVVLELRTVNAFGGYAVGFNIPTDARVVRVGSPAITDGAGGVDPGTAPAAIGAALGTSGKMANVWTAGISQKAAGAGAVTSEASLAADQVLFTVRLEMVPLPLFKPAFDGTAGLLSGLEAAVRNRSGDDVVPGLRFGIGKLAVE
ncbi:MAG: hypothetical protein M3Y59_13405 [Myxococcota bacterium]|nr:hypothetical protein [Myxococcota bacterium]